MFYGEETKEKQYQSFSAADSFRRIDQEGTSPWVAVGDFVDDFQSAENKVPLVLEAPDEPSLPENARWAAFFAAAVDWLCWQNEIPAPAWVRHEKYILSEPWFLYDYWKLRMWQLVDTPVPFKMRNIFGGDRILNRV